VRDCEERLFQVADVFTHNQRITQARACATRAQSKTNELKILTTMKDFACR